jgi:ADP-ribose pyrophosphatase
MPDNESEQTVDTELAYAGRLVTVRRETVRLPDGSATTREIVVHPDGVAMLPLLADGRILLERQYRKAVDRVLLEIPAGVIDPGETPENAAHREMKEETGYTVGTLRLLTSFHTSPGFTTELMHLYEATDLEPGEPTEEQDRIEVVALSIADARQRWRDGEIADAKTILGLLLLERDRYDAEHDDEG